MGQAPEAMTDQGFPSSPLVGWSAGRLIVQLSRLRRGEVKTVVSSVSLGGRGWRLIGVAIEQGLQSPLIARADGIHAPFAIFEVKFGDDEGGFDRVIFR